MVIYKIVAPEGVEVPNNEKVEIIAHELDKLDENSAIEYSTCEGHRAIMFKTKNEKYCIINTYKPTEEETEASNTICSAPLLVVEFINREREHSSYEIIPFVSEISGIIEIYCNRKVGDKVEVYYFNNRSTYNFAFDELQELLVLPAEFEKASVVVRINEKMKLLRKSLKTTNTTWRHMLSIDDSLGKAVVDEHIWDFLELMDCAQLNEEFFNLTEMR